MTPVCRTVQVIGFRGGCSKPFATNFHRQLHEARSGRNQGPSLLDCVLYAGHAGISTDDSTTVYGFNPVSGSVPVWQVFDELSDGHAFPGIVTDDTPVFSAAQSRGWEVISFNVVVPE